MNWSVPLHVISVLSVPFVPSRELRFGREFSRGVAWSGMRVQSPSHCSPPWEIFVLTPGKIACLPPTLSASTDGRRTPTCDQTSVPYGFEGISHSRLYHETYYADENIARYVEHGGACRAGYEAPRHARERCASPHSSLSFDAVLGEN